MLARIRIAWERARYPERLVSSDGLGGWRVSPLGFWRWLIAKRNG